MIKMNVDKMFSIGSNIWPDLSKITEEAGEVLQVIGKLVGTGGEIMHWDGSNLLERLIEEIGDVLAACEFVISVNNIDLTKVEERRKQKLALFFKWHNEIQGKIIYHDGDLIRLLHHGPDEGYFCKIKNVINKINIWDKVNKGNK